MRLASVLAIAAFASPAVAGPILIDSFDTPLSDQNDGVMDGVISDAPGGGPTTDDSTGAGILGTRHVTLEQQSGSGPVSAEVNGGRYRYSEDGGSDGETSLVWTFAPTDLTMGGTNDRLALSIHVDLAVELEMEIVVGAHSGAGDDAVVLFLPDGFDGVVAIPFADFSGVDFGDVTAVDVFLDVDPSNATVVFLDELVVVPEPGSLGLVSLGLAALASARRQRRAELA